MHVWKSTKISSRNKHIIMAVAIEWSSVACVSCLCNYYRRLVLVCRPDANFPKIKFSTTTYDPLNSSFFFACFWLHHGTKSEKLLRRSFLIPIPALIKSIIVKKKSREINKILVSEKWINECGGTNKTPRQRCVQCPPQSQLLNEKILLACARFLSLFWPLLLLLD